MARVLGVLGGSGIYSIPGLKAVEQVTVETPFGEPSDVIVQGVLEGTTLLFLPRHGRGHRIPPHSINYRANLAALKILGAQQVVSLSAVGSMDADIRPGDFVVAEQFIDLTKGRAQTFFDGDLAVHVSLADPVCPQLSRALGDAARRAGAWVHDRGTYVCIEGPQFSTRAESHLYRSWGVSVIGMTGMPEARLAREAELPYAVLALATDYDCWLDRAGDVSVEEVVKVTRKNSDLAKSTLVELVRELPDPALSPAVKALDGALMTSLDALSEATRSRLGWLLGPNLERWRPAASESAPKSPMKKSRTAGAGSERFRRQEPEGKARRLGTRTPKRKRP